MILLILQILSQMAQSLVYVKGAAGKICPE